MRMMRDSTTASDIPADTPAVAYYIDGAFAWPEEALDRFDAVPALPITVNPAHNIGQFLDCESGDATPGQCPAWVQMRRTSGARPGVYCNRSTWPVVQAAFARANVAQPDWWIADWTGQPHAIPGAAIVQYSDPSTSGGHFDDSEVFDESLLPAPVTAPAPTPVPTPAPAPPVPHEWSENMQNVPIHIAALDDQGNGWFDVPGAANRVVSVKVNGSDPTQHGYPSNHLAWESLANGADERVVLLGGVPHAELDINVWVAQP